MEPKPRRLLNIEIVPNERPDVQIVKLNGPITIHNFDEFQELTRKQPFPPVLLVDLKSVPYIDSAALGGLVSIHVSCQAGARKYAFIGPNERLENLFDLTQVGTFLVTYGSVEDAIAHLV